MISINFWQNKSVFLTGHTGFKGGWLALWLMKMGAKLTALGLPPNTQPNLFNLARVSEGMQSILGDIRDLSAVQAAINQAKPEIVFHLAAKPLVRQSFADPLATYSTNVMGTANVLEAIRQHNIHGGNICAVVNVTSDKCYENKEWVWGYREDEPMGGYDPYSSSKACSELITAAYRRSYFEKMHIHLASARAGNVIGGGDFSPDRLIPDILRAFEKGEPALIRNPHATRPWQHVLEALSGYLLLAEKLYIDGTDFAQAWNFAAEEQDVHPVSWISDYMVKLWNNSEPSNYGCKADWHYDNAEHPHEAHYLKLDICKAKTKLNWQPKIKLTQALKMVIDWQMAYKSKSIMLDICQAQINEFMKLDN